MTTAPETKIDLKPAAQRLVGGFSMIDTRWLAVIAKELDQEDCFAFPAHGWAFKVDDSADRRAIEKLLRPFLPEDLDGMVSFMENYDIELDVASYEVPPHHMDQLADAANDSQQLNPTHDLDELRSDIANEWEPSGCEDYWLDMSGWQRVGDTGLLACVIDESLMLAINGGGYDFYEAHWIPLYQALGYSWHKGA